MSERLVTSFRLPGNLYDRWRGLSRKQGWSARERIIGWMQEDLKVHGIDVPPKQARTGWWGGMPQIDAEALVKARDAAGLSQSALAKLADIQPSTLSRYESKSTKYINEEIAKRLASELQIEISSILHTGKS